MINSQLLFVTHLLSETGCAETSFYNCGNIKNELIGTCISISNWRILLRHGSDNHGVSRINDIQELAPMAYAYTNVNTILFDNGMTVSNLREKTFYKSSVNQISYLNNVMTIEEECFAHSQINELYFGNVLNTIDMSSLRGCNNLRKMTFKSAPFFINNEELYNLTYLETIFVPASELEYFQRSFPKRKTIFSPLSTALNYSGKEKNEYIDYANRIIDAYNNDRTLAYKIIKEFIDKNGENITIDLYVFNYKNNLKWAEYLLLGRMFTILVVYSDVNNYARSLMVNWGRHLLVMSFKLAPYSKRHMVSLFFFKLLRVSYTAKEGNIRNKNSFITIFKSLDSGYVERPADIDNFAKHHPLKLISLFELYLLKHIIPYLSNNKEIQAFASLSHFSEIEKRHRNEFKDLTDIAIKKTALFYFSLWFTDVNGAYMSCIDKECSLDQHCCFNDSSKLIIHEENFLDFEEQISPYG